MGSAAVTVQEAPMGLEAVQPVAGKAALGWPKGTAGKAALEALKGTAGKANLELKGTDSRQKVHGLEWLVCVAQTPEELVLDHRLVAEQV